ncbi:MAG: hypothetical protein K2W92_02810 [Alphaproteobacteria bacterium]|nr:hypothetical protein [Alphaproteobacteria bacterium]
MKNQNLLITVCENVGFFFVNVLDSKTLRAIKEMVQSMKLENFVVHGFVSAIDDSHFIKIENKI